LLSEYAPRRRKLPVRQAAEREIDFPPVFRDAFRMSEEDDEALKARRDKLAGALKAARPAPARGKAAPADSTAAAMSMGLRAGSEFVAAILVGGAIGFGIDWVAHTKPAFTIVFFLLGVVAGVFNVIRATSPKGGH
jgi:ATP synthase protein I